MAPLTEPVAQASFTRMDASTAEDWAIIGRQASENLPRVGDQILAMLGSLAAVNNGFAVDQLTHSLQTATRAMRDGASEDLVMVALCHDIGKAISVRNHGAIAAEILEPYVSDDLYELVRTHQDFQGRHYYHHFDLDPNARHAYRAEPWYLLAERFADEWDQVAFDPDYDTLGLDHFEPAVRAFFAAPRST